MQTARLAGGRGWAKPLAFARVVLLAGCAILACDAAPSDVEPAPTVREPVLPAKGLAELPHLLVLLADDLGWNDVGYHGSEIRTPRIDALAQAGVRAEAFHVQAVCTATRAALLTGRYPMRYGLQEVIWPWATHGLDAAEETLGELLQRAGYETSLVGKWHLGMATHEQLPTRRGFEHFYGHLGGMVDYYEHTKYKRLDWFRGEQPLREAGYTTDLMADEAIRRLRARDPRRPHFQLVAFNAPHTPIQDPPGGVAEYADIPSRIRRTYAGMVTHMDHAIGRILDAYEAEGLRERTLVVFLSDNGGSVREGAQNAPLRGGKATPFQGGVQVPAIWSWPGRIPMGDSLAEPLHVVDVLPTLAALAGVEPRGELDGVDVLDRVAGGGSDAGAERELLLELGPKDAALRVGSWKLVVRGPRDGAPRISLYDLAADESESRDLSQAESERAAAMLARLRALDAMAVPSLAGPPTPPPGYQPPAVWGPAGD